MKFSDAMKALEEGETVERVGKPYRYALRDGKFERWVRGTPYGAAPVIPGSDVVGDWEIVADGDATKKGESK